MLNKTIYFKIKNSPAQPPYLIRYYLLEEERRLPRMGGLFYLKEAAVIYENDFSVQPSPRRPPLCHCGYGG
jgi:hypothetical protein